MTPGEIDATALASGFMLGCATVVLSWAVLLVLNLLRRMLSDASDV